MTFQISPDIIESNDVSITENAGGDLEITHVPSGESVTVGPAGFAAGAVDADSVSVTNSVGAGAVNADRFNADASCRLGRTVYYNPASSGPYIDGADAFADVPPGGTFIIAAGTDYDVATEGRLVMNDAEGKTICGEGWSADDGFTYSAYSGSKIVNMGADAIDSPVIEFSSTNREQRGVVVKDLSIHHEGATTPAILIDNAMKNVVEDCTINMETVGKTGVETINKSFFTRILRTHVHRFTDYGLHLKGQGGGGSVVDCHIGSGQAGSVGTRVERDGIYISGGQHSSNGAGIEFYNSGSNANQGSYVDGHIWFEKCDDAIRIDGGTYPYNNVTIVNPRTSLDSAGIGVNNLVNIGHGENIRVVHPSVFRQTDGGNLGTLGSNSRRVKFIGDYSNVGVPPVVDNGSENPTKIIQESLTDGYISNIDTSIPVWVALRRSTSGDWGPVFHDGTDWYKMSSANATFIP